MDPVHDFESINAKEWDETSQAAISALSQARTLRNAIPELINTHEQDHSPPVKLYDPVADISALPDPKAWKIPVANVEDKTNIKPKYSYRGEEAVYIMNPNPNFKKPQPGTCRRYVGDEKNDEHSVPWPSTPGLLTNRRRAELEKNAARAAEKDICLKPHPLGMKFGFTGYYLWLNGEILPEQVISTELDKIRKTCHVYIDYDRQRQSLRIDSETRASLQEAVDRIKAAVNHFKSEEDLFPPLHIVEPPAVAAMRPYVSPIFQADVQDLTVIKNSPTTNKPRREEPSPKKHKVVDKLILTGNLLEGNEVNAWIADRNKGIESNNNLFLGYVRTSVEGLRAIQGGMRMRVHFGHLMLQHYFISFGDQMFPYEKFIKMMRAPRTRMVLEKSVGDLGMAARVILQIQTASNSFCPADALTSSISDVKPKQSLVIFARGPSNNPIRVEADVDIVRNVKKTTYQIGAANYYLHTTRKTRMEVDVKSFEFEYDWALELITNDVIQNIPKAFQQLVVSSLPVNSPEQKDQFGFVYPGVVLRPQSGLVIDDVKIRTVFQYRVPKTSYIVELSLYRHCDGQTGEETTGSFGMSFFSDDWDFRMGHRHDVPYDWQPGADLKEFSLTTPKTNAFNEFLAKVKDVQALLGSVLS